MTAPRRRWTPETIRAELEPMSRNGGLDHWREAERALTR
jgi:hypothetical protein